MTLLAPWWLGLAAATLVVLWWRRGSPGDRLTVSSGLLVEGLPVTWRWRLRRAPLAMRCVACAVAAVAMADPVFERAEHSANQPGIDVILLVDVSQSMMALDGRPDRLGTARAVAEQLVRRRPRDRVGIVLFAGEDTLAAPVTSDLRAVVDRLRTLEVTDGVGTALGPALLGAADRLPQGEPGAVVVLSDGASNTGDVTPSEAARRIAETGVQVVTIGIGRNGTAGFQTEFGLIDVPVVIDEAGLREVAAAGRGAYVRADDVSRAADAVAARLDTIEPAARMVVETSALSLGAWFGLAAAFLVAGEMAFALLVLRTTSW